MTDTRLQRKILRQEGLTARRQQADSLSLSQLALEQLVRLESYQRASAVLWYISAKSELATHVHVQQALQAKELVAVPYCDGDSLQLFKLQDWAELDRGAFGILEPKLDLRHLPQRSVSIETIDFVVVPGVRFDRSGHRLGHGQGFYDRLLASCRDSTITCGVCFESQLAEAIPHEPHDVPMHLVITEQATYECKRQATE